MTPTHAEVLAAIDKARHDPDEWDGLIHGGSMIADAGNDHCDDLRATAERHAPKDRYSFDGYAGKQCLICRKHPCPDYRQVIDRLTGWGAL